jgi:translation initiation factor 2 subunit 3
MLMESTNNVSTINHTNYTALPDENLARTLKNQPIINIGCLGSVSDGKSTLVERLTGIRTQKHSSEQKRNITIKQGYGNMKVWSDGTNLYTTNSKSETYTTEDGDVCNLLNHISFVDCPGHQELIQTMLSSISLMDGAIVVVAVDQPLDKKPQLIQHLAAAKLGKIEKIIVCMNKIDLVSKDVLMERKQQLDEMLASYDIKPFVIIPTCFNKRIGLDVLLKAIMVLFHPSNFMGRTSDSCLFRISRTFDINKPGVNWDAVVGGVMGGSLMTGTLKVGDKIEIRPGQVSGSRGKFICQPVKTEILSIKTDDNELGEIAPGGLTGIRTDLDPFYSKNDALAGNIAGPPGTLPSVYVDTTIDSQTVTTFGFVWEPKVSDVVMLQVGTRMVEGKLSKINGSKINGSKLTFELNKPACIHDNQHIIICKTIDKILRIVGEGTMLPEDNATKLIV